MYSKNNNFNQFPSYPVQESNAKQMNKGQSGKIAQKQNLLLLSPENKFSKEFNHPAMSPNSVANNEFNMNNPSFHRYNTNTLNSVNKANDDE